MKVFLDMDDVMVDFVGGLHRLLDIPYNIKQYPYVLGKWEMLNKEVLGFSYKTIDSICTAEFWRNLQWTEDGRSIFSLVQRHFGFRSIHLATKIMSNPGCCSGKYLWVCEHLEDYFAKHLILISGTKAVLAGPGSLLIDDCDKNVEEFRAAGGQAILVPRPWNKLHEQANNTLQVVKYELEKIR